MLSILFNFKAKLGLEPKLAGHESAVLPLHYFTLSI